MGSITLATPAPKDSVCVIPQRIMVSTMHYIKVETISSTGERYPYGGQLVKVELKPKSHDGLAVSGDVVDHRDGTYTITLTPQTAGPHQLVVKMDGQHVLQSPFDLTVKSDYTTLHDPKQVIDLSTRPYCTAVIYGKGEVYVGTDDHVYVLDSNGNLKDTIGIQGSGNGQFNGAAGIALKGGVMYVADYYNHRIQKLTAEGEYIAEYGREGSNQGQFN